VARREEDGDPAPEAEAVAPAVTQPLGTAKRGRPTKGIDEAES
jgi:hypothetical protein